MSKRKLEEAEFDEIETIEAENGEAEVEEGYPDDDGEADEGDEDEEADPNVNDEADGGDDNDGTLTVTIGGDDDEDAKAPQWVRDLRARNRELNEEVRRLKEATAAPVTQQATQLRAKPTLADHDYDDDAFAADLEKWFGEKREHDTFAEESRRREEARTQQWNAKMAKFEEGKKALGAADIDEAEAVIVNTFDQMQMGIVVEGAKNPALVFYALGKNPARAAELAKIESPIEFARAIFELEGGLKVNNRKAPAPEKLVRGGKGGGAADNTLERLREEAARTGDYSKVIAFKARQRK